MRFNRFVFLNRPMLSLEAHLGVIASPQTPFPADFVTLPVSASYRRFGSFPLAAEERQAPCYNIIELCIPNMLKQRHPNEGGLRWLGVLYVMSPTHAWLGAATVKLRLRRFGAIGRPCLLSVVTTRKRRLPRARIGVQARLVRGTVEAKMLRTRSLKDSDLLSSGS